MMQRFLLLIFILITTPVLAQTYSTTNKKAIRHFEDGKIYYDRKQLDEAIASFEKAVETDSMFIESYILLAESWNEKRDYKKAVENYNKAFRINPNFFPMNYLWAAILENALGMYEEGKMHAEKFLTFPIAARDPEKQSLAERTRDASIFSLNAMANPVPFTPTNLGEAINSKQNEYFPAITADDQVLLFTRELPDPRSQAGRQEDFYMASRDKDGNWTKAFDVGSPINTGGNEGAPTLSADGRIIIFTACEVAPGYYGPNRQGYGSCDLYYTSRTGTKWTTPVNIGKPINSNAWETQPSFSADGKTIYFIRGTSRGYKRNGDIYSSTVNNAGYWSEPTRLSDKINTPGEEQSVFIHPDGQTLYFSSNGHIGLGGYDIYMTRKQADGSWGNPVNLGYPINTAGDENSLLVSADGKIGYFASDREGGFGGLDLYSFPMPESSQPKQIAYMQGKIYDAETKKPLEALFELIDLSTGVVTIQSYSDPATGEFLVVLPSGKNYALNVSAENYLFYSENFQMGEGTQTKPFRRDVPLNPFKEGQSVVLRNVFFNTASAQLRDESKIELNKLVEFLEKNSTVSIELSGHTDNVGDDRSNQVLSENRAKAVMEYLINKGISESRLTSKGYGETKPIASNDTEEGRQQNRRTEFRITGK